MTVFLCFIFDYISYNELINHKRKIMNLLVNHFMYLNLKHFKSVGFSKYDFFGSLYKFILQ